MLGSKDVITLYRLLAMITQLKRCKTFEPWTDITSETKSVQEFITTDN